MVVCRIQLALEKGTEVFEYGVENKEEKGVGVRREGERGVALKIVLESPNFY